MVPDIRYALLTPQVACSADSIVGCIDGLCKTGIQIRTELLETGFNVLEGLPAKVLEILRHKLADLSFQAVPSPSFTHASGEDLFDELTGYWRERILPRVRDPGGLSHHFIPLPTLRCMVRNLEELRRCFADRLDEFGCPSLVSAEACRRLRCNTFCHFPQLMLEK